MTLLCGLALALVGSGCGGGELASKIGNHNPLTMSTQPPAPGGPKAAAKSVNLRAEDFPYLRQRGREPNSDADRKSQEEFEACVGEKHPKSELAGANSPSFTGTLGGELLEFGSNTEVFASSADAARIAVILRGHRVFACLERLLEPALERDEATGQLELVSARAVRLPTPAPSVAGSFGYRISATVAPVPESRQLTAYASGPTPEGPTLTVYLDILDFVSGPISVELSATGGPRPVPRPLERNLLKLLRSRAETAAGGLR